MEKKIVKMLIKNPRISDMKISELSGISYKTVNRKRQKLENAGLINYYTEDPKYFTKKSSTQNEFSFITHKLLKLTK